MPATTKSTKAKPVDGRGDGAWTDEEKAAIAEYAREKKKPSRRDPAAERAAGEQELLAKIAEMPD